MKTYKDFLSSRIVKSEPEVVVEQPLEPEILELEELPNLLGEEQNHHEPIDPPNVLVMRRKSIRVFPNNQRVALYYVDKINKYVTVPYTAMQWSATGVTEEEFQKGIIQQVEDATNKIDATCLVFEDGSTLNINSHSAKEVLKTYNSLNEENKKQFAEVANRSKQDFIEIKKFAKQI